MAQAAPQLQESQAPLSAQATGEQALPVTNAGRSLPRAWIVDFALLFGFLLPLAVFLCFYNLDSPSIHFRDEGTHVRATQEMISSGRWWLPTVNGVPYFNKPPFKMWLSFIPLSVFGQSAFAFRFIDALAGVLSCLLVYAFAKVFLRSRAAAVFAVLGLLGSESFFFEHGARNAVQESMLGLLNLLSLCFGWLLLSRLGYGQKLDTRSPFPSKHPWMKRLAVLIGVFTGLAILTKSAAGLLPLLIAATYLIFSGSAINFLQNHWRILALLLAVSTVIPGTYFVPHFLLTPEAFGVAFTNEVVKRATEGYHNQDRIFFYLERLFLDRRALAPEVLLAALVFAAGWLWRSGSKVHLFLLVWAIFPVAFFSALPSRLTWYIAPAFPAMALLAGDMLSRCFHTVCDFVGSKQAVTRTKAFIAASVLLVSCFFLGQNLLKVSNRVLAPKKRIALDLLAEDINRHAAIFPKSQKVVSLKRPEFSLHERAHGGMIERLLTSVASVDEAFKLLDSGTHHFVLADLSAFPEFLATGRVQAYRYFPPVYDRKHWMVALTTQPAQKADLSAGSMEIAPSLTPVTQVIDFGGGNINQLFGLGEEERYGEVTVQAVKGNSAGILFMGDLAQRKFGVVAELNLAAFSSASIRVQVRVNETLVDTFALERSDYRSRRMNIPPQAVRNGRNSLYLVLERVDQNPIDDDETLIKLNWLSLSVAPPVQQ